MSPFARRIQAGASSQFLHPGVLLTAPMMSFTAANIGSSPYSTAWSKVTNKTQDVDASNNVGLKYSSLSWIPHAQATVSRGSGGGSSNGDDALVTDAMAAYVHALAWSYTGNRANANKAIDILNAWSSTLTNIPFSGSDSSISDGKLLAGWVGSILPRAGEILRHTFVSGGGDSVLDVSGLQSLLQGVFVPLVYNGWTGGGVNWLLSMTEAMVQIGVFCDDRATFETGCDNWRMWVPASIYMSGDVNGHSYSGGGSANLPIAPPLTMYDSNGLSGGRQAFISYWHDPIDTPPWIDGLWGEIGRDPWHSAMGFSAMINAAETAWHQGVDLYGEQQNRICTALELQCGWLADVFADGQNPPQSAPWPFAAAMSNNGASNSQRATWEIAYNHYHNRMGVSLPKTLDCLTRYCRTGSYVVNLHMIGENITHLTNVS